MRLKQANPHLKTLISVGGWTWSKNFSDVALTSQSRETFVASCVDLFVKEHGFDGIDIDWEYPGGGGKPGNISRPEDKHNNTLLMQEFRRQLDDLDATDGLEKDYLVTIAPSADSKKIANLKAKELAATVDWINVMTYDYNGGWAPKTGFNAPLFAASGDPTPTMNVDSTIKTFLAAGVEANKLVLGVPFYGRGWSGTGSTDNGLFQSAQKATTGTWENGIYDYQDLKDNYVDKNGFTRHWNAESKVPFLYKEQSGDWISYDDVESFKEKTKFARENGLGGAMFWELSGDRDGDLLDTLYQELIGS